MEKVVAWVQAVLVPLLGPPGLFVVAFLDSSFLSLPEINDILVVTSAIANPSTAWIAVAMSTLGSLAGCSVLWELGRRGGEALIVRRFGAERAQQTRVAFQRWNILALALPAMLPPPMPFKVFVVSAVALGIRYRRFAAIISLARGLRYAFWAVMGGLYGDEAQALLRAVDHWFLERQAILFAGLGLTTLAAVATWLWHRRRARTAAAGAAGSGIIDR